MSASSTTELTEQPDRLERDLAPSAPRTYPWLGLGLIAATAGVFYALLFKVVMQG
jgi:hypothetical protein